jgi:transcriptional regulator with XRE-family HTH domain
MSHIETGNTKLSLAVLVKIALALEVNTDDLLFNHVSINKSSLTAQILETLDKCSPQELIIIYDIIKATQISLAKHL